MSEEIKINYKRKTQVLESPLSCKYIPCVEVGVEVAGVDMGFSQREGEKEWYCDSAFKVSNCYPLFNHGVGDRCCKKSFAKGELKEAIENFPTEEEQEKSSFSKLPQVW